MRSQPRESRTSKFDRKIQWNDWYAWYPVRAFFNDYSRVVWVWRETVQRKYTPSEGGNQWSYRIKT